MVEVLSQCPTNWHASVPQALEFVRTKMMRNIRWEFSKTRGQNNVSRYSYSRIWRSRRSICRDFACASGRRG